MKKSLLGAEVGQRRALLIAGPTASGKSALAIRLARRCNGVVVNADSMQLYRDLRILTARPGPEDERAVSHSLYGCIDGASNYSAGLWLADIKQIIDDLWQAGKMPVITGGTGLYFKALTQGLSDIPSVPEDIRASVRASAAGLAPEILHTRLALTDPVMAARLRPGDSQRILRALEVYAATGVSLAAFQGARQAPVLERQIWHGYFLAPERVLLHQAIEGRFAMMMDKGALEETEALCARQLDPALPVMRAHGVPHLAACLDGRLSRTEAIARSISDTRAYAKRQYTFVRHQLPEFSWVSPDRAEAAIAADMQM